MGNKMGWAIAGGILAVFVLVLVVLIIVPSRATTPPTEATTSPGALALHAIEIPVEQVVGYTPSEGGNAGDDYARAVATVEESEDDLRLGLRGGDFSPEARAIAETVYEHVRAGAAKAEMRYAVEHTGGELEVDPSPDFCQPINRVATLLDRLARDLLAMDMPEEAAKVWRAEFVLGWHLSRERALAGVVRTGYGIQREALRSTSGGRVKGGLLKVAQLADDGEQVGRLEAYLARLDDVSAFHREKYTVVWNRDFFKHAGDVFNVMNNDEDRAWRNEAILALGPLKFTQANHENDMAYINEQIEAHKQADDPVAAAAARAAERFTKAQFNVIGRE